MSTMDWRMDPGRAWALYSAALMDEAVMRRLNTSWGEDLAEDTEGLRPVLLREVSAAWTADEGGRG